jgi:methionyl-tRNA formyltransferase
MTKSKKILFIGSKKIGYECLLFLNNFNDISLVGAMTIDDSSDTRSYFSEFTSFCTKNSIDIFIVKNKKESGNLIKKLKPDLCIVVGWYWIIDKEVLDSVPYGFIGIHFSLLPKYRGGSPLVWAIINGENETGVSLFSFSTGIDDGDIWAQKSVTIEFDDYVSDVLNKLEIATMEMLNENLKIILDGNLVPSKQNESMHTYVTPRKPSDGQIEWNMPSIDVYNFIRAHSNPYPGAFTYLNGEKLSIWHARAVKSNLKGEPGQVISITDEGALIMCGDGTPLVIEIVQLEGHLMKPANEVITRVGIKLL